MTSMITHMAKDMVKNQVLGTGFKTFKDLKIEFDEDQIKVLEKYLDALLSETIFKVEEKKLSIEDEELSAYITELLGTILDLTITSFTNWAIALYHKDIILNNMQ